MDVAQRPHQRDGRRPGGPRPVHRAAATLGTDAERDAFEAPILAEYERQGSPYYSTARLWDDGVIDPLDTRRVLAMGISAALNAEIGETRFGVFRM